MVIARLIFILCIIGSINTFKIYNFIHDEIPFLFNSDICTTEICERDAQYLSSSLNKSVDPCDDFYEFACGGWLSQNKRPSTEPVWGQWETIMKKVEDNIENILTELPESTDSIPLGAAKDMYNACMKSENDEKESLEILNTLLNTFGGWPLIHKDWDFSETWLMRAAKINSYLNVHPFLKFHVNVDLYNTSKYILYIDHPSFIFPKAVFSDPPLYERHLKEYELYIINSALELSHFLNNSQISLKNIKRDAFEIVKLETKLVNIMSMNENNNLSRLYKRITIDHLQFLTDFITKQENGTRIIWTEILGELFKSMNINISNNDQIIVKDLSYVIKLINLINRSSKKAVANYLGWSILKKYTKDSSKNLRRFSFAMDEILHGLQEDIPRRQYCIAMVNNNLGMAVSHQYVKKYFNTSVKNEVQNMMEIIKSILINKLESLKWLDTETKSKALEKAKEIGILVGYPDWLNNITHIEHMYKGVEITKYHLLNIISCQQFNNEKEMSRINSTVISEKWSGLPTDVNAYYNILKNVVIFPTGILQYPFYETKRLDVLNYGAIGTVIGHELSHAFDNTGRQADKNGNFIQWWSKESLEKYNENVKCFHEHYNKYTVDINDEETGRKILIDGESTQDENIADLIGLQLAYEAYTYLKNTHLDQLKLPTLENYTTDQYFFISYANQWCEISSKEQLASDVTEGGHTPTRIRVLGTLTNSEEFNKAFNCPASSPMNPKKKCSLW